ncbi:MAG: hypothetical protein UDQ92_03690 [Lachnospiraceae bacterium]|nr:hypothetical protein [Lachnospiraceae bacterium]
MSVLFRYEEKYERVRLLDYFKTGIPTDAYTRELQEEVEETAEDLEEDISVIEPIYDAVKKSAPEYNVEKIYRKLNENG